MCKLTCGMCWRSCTQREEWRSYDVNTVNVKSQWSRFLHYRLVRSSSCCMYCSAVKLIGFICNNYCCFDDHKLAVTYFLIDVVGLAYSASHGPFLAGLNRFMQCLIFTITITRCKPNTVWAPTGALEKTPRATALHLAQKHQRWPDLVWHGATGGKRCSSESTFLENAGFV